MIWYYVVTHNREKMLWYISEIKRYPDGAPYGYYLAMRREIKKTLRKQKRML